MREHLLQSREWQNFEKLEGAEVFELNGKGWSARGVVEKTRAGKYLYVKYGPAIEAKKFLAPALAALANLAREKGAIFVRVEPVVRFSEAEMKKMGCRRSKELDPEHTWVLDLTRPEEEILAGMERSTVKFWRNAAKKGISVRVSENPDDIDVLMPFLSEVASERHFAADDAERLKNQVRAGFSKLYIAEIPDEVGSGRVAIAASLIYDYDGVRYSVHSGSDFEHRKLRGGMVLSVTKILDAKRAGMEKYDFWGITTSNDPKHPWYGFTQHKKSFGGEQVDYAGTYDMPVDKGRYLLYRVLRKINLMLRKVRK